MLFFDWIYKLTRFTLGGIFIYAGTVKLMAPKTFAVLIEAFGLVPESLLMTVALVLPAIEVVAGIGLLFDIEGSLSVITALLVLFLVILGYGIRMGLDIDCGCFGPEDPEAEAFHGLRSSLYRDLVMLAGVVSMYGWRRYRGIKPHSMALLIKKLWNGRRTENAYG